MKVDKERNSLCKPKKPDNPDKIFGKFKYRLNAHIGSTHSITYGVVAARIKSQPLQGQHASLWMQPTYASDSTSAAKQGTEIDIIEWFGKDVPNGGLTSFIYAPSRGGKKIALGGEGGRSRSPSSTSRTTRTTGTSATTCSPSSGTRRATSSGSTARRRVGSTRASPASPSSRS